MTNNKDRFKFKFFEKKTKILFQWEDICIEKDQVLIINEDSMIGRYISFDDGDLIQCTSIKDHNGKLIYEGDIILDEENDENNIIIHDPILNCFVVSKKDKQSFTNSYDYTFSLENYGDGQNYDLQDIEIIGNKYENPELLKE